MYRNCCGIDPWQPSQKLFRIPRQSRSGVRGIFQYRKDSPPCSPQPRISHSNSSSKLLLLKLTPAFFDISNLDSQGLGLHGSGLLHSCLRIHPGPVLEGLRLHSVPGCLLLQLWALWPAWGRTSASFMARPRLPGQFQGGLSKSLMH